MPWVWQYCSAPKMYLCLHFLAYIGSLSGMSTLHSDFQQHLARPQLVYDQPHQKGSLTGLADWLFNEPLYRGFLMFASLSVVFCVGGIKEEAQSCFTEDVCGATELLIWSHFFPLITNTRWPPRRPILNCPNLLIWLIYLLFLPCSSH